MKEFFDKFSNLKSASFIGINNYQNKFGEVANVSLVANVDYGNALKKDFETLKNVTDKDINDIFLSCKDQHEKMTKEVVKTAFDELLTSFDTNLNGEKTNQSKGQTDAYITLTNSVKLHKESMNVYVWGMFNNKKILVEGEYPKTNKHPKTIAKDAIKKHLNLKTPKYKQYILGQMDKISVTGDTLTLK